MDSKWKYCKLSNKRLQLPIVSDYKGNLFNKEAILEWLLTPGREDYSNDQIKNFSHIKKLDDVIELRNLKEIESTDEGHNSGSTIVCEYGEGVFGKSVTQFIYLATCDDVLPVKALDLVNKKICPKCGIPYQTLDVIMIYPPGLNDVKRLEDRHEMLRKANKHHNGRKKKLKRKRESKNGRLSQLVKNRKVTPDSLK